MKNKLFNLIYILFRDFFLIAGFNFFLFLIADLLIPRFVSAYINFNIFLIIVVFSGIMAVVLKEKKEYD